MKSISTKFYHLNPYRNIILSNTNLSDIDSEKYTYGKVKSFDLFPAADDLSYVLKYSYSHDYLQTLRFFKI